jgi:hypothetical protein
LVQFRCQVKRQGEMSARVIAENFRMSTLKCLPTGNARA